MQTIDIKPTEANDNEPNIIVLSFADSKIPVFKEARNRDLILYGEDNNYGAYLLTLFNKSAKHNAIVTGKARYVFGKGFENGDMIVNRLNESLNDVVKKCILDLVIFGGFRVEVIYNYKGKICELYHVDYNKLRKAKNGGYWFKNGDWSKTFREYECTHIEAFDPHNPTGSQIYEYVEYRPGIVYYPLPEYVGINNHIETDIEIGKYNLSAIKNGMNPGKLIQFFQGEPSNEKKASIEQRMQKKFAGSENAGKFILVFNKQNDKAAEVSDLSATDLDKLFDGMNKTTQQEIYAGHGVTSPLLFGIKTEGQLGGNTELQTAYSIFQNTYSKPKAKDVDKEFSYLLTFSTFNGKYELQPTDPIGINIDVNQVLDKLPVSFIFDKLGIESSDTVQPQGATVTGQPAASNTATGMVNEHIRSLTGQQLRRVENIVKKYNNGSYSEIYARTLLRGFGLTDEDINALLGIQENNTVAVVASKFISIDDVEEVIDVFDNYGNSKNDFEILKTKTVAFAADEAEEDEAIFIQEAFKSYDVTASEAKILELIQKDSKITPKVIAETIDETEKYVSNKIADLIKRGYIEETETIIGEDTILERKIAEGIDISKPPVQINDSPISKLKIMYSYEGPQDNRNRPFCARLMKLNRLYSRADIEQISQRVGYSVFDRRGGFWRHKDGTTTAYCRHKWKSNIVIKK